MSQYDSCNTPRAVRRCPACAGADGKYGKRKARRLTPKPRAPCCALGLPLFSLTSSPTVLPITAFAPRYPGGTLRYRCPLCSTLSAALAQARAATLGPLCLVEAREPSPPTPSFAPRPCLGCWFQRQPLQQQPCGGQQAHGHMACMYASALHRAMWRSSPSMHICLRHTRLLCIVHTASHVGIIVGMVVIAPRGCLGRPSTSPSSRHKSSQVTSQV